MTPNDCQQRALAMMTEEVAAHVERQGWNDDRTFGDVIALLHSECSEALEAYRKRGFHAWTDERGKPEGVASEFADLFIRLLDNCQRYGIDLWAEYRRKMDYNYTRPYRHGGDRVGEVATRVSQARDLPSPEERPLGDRVFVVDEGLTYVNRHDTGWASYDPVRQEWTSPRDYAD